eukprot:TRINITY_DN39996_c0_g1_i3.p1 TRINITY_DN39996_c0_g1~~TRINITY_DN39996_c0_g1_i3.p1  ORF type:complete len:370 (-),score=59.63 TRINITY_DN39996_c0_g1_i3:192-1301(-)
MGGHHSKVLGTTATFPRDHDKYKSLQELYEDIYSAEIESFNLVIGIDYTKSNQWTGTESFGGKNLHSIIENQLNPYEEAMTIIAKMLPKFDEQIGSLPCYGFGDIRTHDKAVFSFNQGDEPCKGLHDALLRYRQVSPNVQMSGPTSFGPIIRQAMHLTNQSEGKYHLLLIIADGQVSGSELADEMSYQNKDTLDALVEASHYPISIVIVGVGDGPWDHMSVYDDSIIHRKFDNLQFVNFTQIMANSAPDQKEGQFALTALMEVPDQYRYCVKHKLLGRTHKFKKQFTEPLCPPNEEISQQQEDEKQEEIEILHEQVQEQLQNLILEKSKLFEDHEKLTHENQNLKELLVYAAGITYHPPDEQPTQSTEE